MPIWSPWERDPAAPGAVRRTTSWNLPVRRDRAGRWKLPGTAAPVLLCPDEDFFAEGADSLRNGVYPMMRAREDLLFLLFTNDVRQITTRLPMDWGSGYPNVILGIRIPDQAAAEDLEPCLTSLPFAARELILEPLRGPLDLSPLLQTGGASAIFAAGDDDPGGTVLDLAWVQGIRAACEKASVPFFFCSTGARFRIGEKIWPISGSHRAEQAEKSGLSFIPKNGAPLLNSLSRQAAFPSRNPALDDLFLRLSRSGFRSGFSLSEEDRRYLEEKGMETIRRHAGDFVAKRLAPAHPARDGKQTPMRGHPVFPAQHATGCCCRGCLFKWHGIPEGVPLTEAQQRAVTDILMEWIRRQLL
ncbi:MAG: DUF5131 family protein [Lachnospiraceae bacterium]